MAAARRRIQLLFALCLVLLAAAPAAASLASLPQHLPLGHQQLEALAVRLEAPAAEEVLPAPSAAAPGSFSLWSPLPAGYGELFDRERAEVPDLATLTEPEIASGESASLLETRVWAFRLFDPESQLPPNRVSRGNATGFGLGLVAGRVGRDTTNLYAFVGWQPNMATDPTGMVLRVTEKEKAYVNKYYGEKNVTYTEQKDGTFEVGVSAAGFKQMAGYVESMNDPYVERSATLLNQAGASPFYLYPSLHSIGEGGGQWIGQQYEGKSLPGMPEGWAISSPDQATGSMGTAVGNVPIAPYEQTTPGMVQTGLDFALSPQSLLFVLTLMTPAPGDEELAETQVLRYRSATVEGRRVYQNMVDINPGVPPGGSP